MRLVSVRVLLYGIVGTILALYTRLPLRAQRGAVSMKPQLHAVSVPFIGCRSDGQAGPVEALEGTSVSMLLSPDAGKELAYYSYEGGIGVLAPRGWFCFGAYGSNGDTLYVKPEPIDTDRLFSPNPSKFRGPAIEVTRRFGGTSGRFAVAEIIARVFPAFRSFVSSLVQNFDPPSHCSFGPYPKDTLTYKCRSLVEYRTPAQADGLGTYLGLEKDVRPIDGVAILIGQTPDLLLLAVRLPSEVDRLTPAIIGQFERDAARRPATE